MCHETFNFCVLYSCLGLEKLEFAIVFYSFISVFDSHQIVKSQKA